MKYSLKKLDGRFSHHKRFQYYVGFGESMYDGLGPENYNQGLKWCMETYGWSAEIRESEDIRKWYHHSVPFIRHNSALTVQSVSTKNLPNCYNSFWSWSNSMSRLRIYLASDKELAFFQLNFPVDQK